MLDILEIAQTNLTPVALTFVIIYASVEYFRSSTYKLRHIPTIGSSSAIWSYTDSLKFIHNARDMIHEGYIKYPGKAFKVADMSRWIVGVSGRDMIDDIRRATDDQLSFMSAVEETIHADYTMGKPVRLEPFHIATVRSPLTKNLAVRFPDIKDEITEAFADFIPVSKEWISVPALQTIMHIVCRTSNRLFVGLPLCRNTEYRTLNEQFTIHVFQDAQKISMFPRFLRPFVGRYLTQVPKSLRRTIALVGPMIQQRLDNEKRYGPDWPDKPNDLISWLLENAEGHQKNVYDIALRLLAVNFAAIHTSTMAFTNVLYDLAVHPECVSPMRNEVEVVIEAEGWTKVAMGKLRKLDSFIKESQRLTASALSVNRVALQDFTFSNGVTVPAGTYIAAVAHDTHVDGDNYSNPDQFDGFRFSGRREVESESIKHQMVSLSPDYMVFGTGRHACPGRFFAVNEIKVMLAHVLLTYDVKLPNNGPRPENVWMLANSSPNPTAEVLFRKRAVA
ncbi:unnamed protein product [Cyclocybe aegerita]|uniref:Cytochrome P450 n=1 Tax=Cyclocybe aegerita TaxID=1973307 RepID=A0A8S0W7J5_CYCAE|nr:unnamed protein product [Cyclocybe aegerita]